MSDESTYSVVRDLEQHNLSRPERIHQLERNRSDHCAEERSPHDLRRASSELDIQNTQECKTNFRREEERNLLKRKKDSSNRRSERYSDSSSTSSADDFSPLRFVPVVLGKESRLGKFRRQCRIGRAQCGT